MIKKSFVGFMVLAILNLIGCYSFQTISSESINKVVNLDGSEAIRLMTNDYVEYSFNEYSYTVQNDSISGNGYILQLDRKTPFHGKIAFEDVIELNVEKLDGVASFGLAFGVAIIGLILVFVIEFNKNIN